MRLYREQKIATIRSTWRSILSRVLAIGVCFSLSHPVLAELYRWVDQHGQVQYSDQIPSKDAKVDKQVINESGRVVKTLEGQKTPEEIEEERRLKAIADKREREERQKRARDMAILATFSSVDDMHKARDERINMVEQSIALSEKRLSKKQAELDRIEKVKQGFIDRKQNVPEWTHKNSAKIEDQMDTIQSYIQTKLVEKQQIQKKFDADIARYRELTGS